MKVTSKINQKLSNDLKIFKKLKTSFKKNLLSFFSEIQKISDMIFLLISLLFNEVILKITGK